MKAYAQLVKYRVGRMSSDWLPKCLATLRSRVYKIIGIPSNPIELVDANTPVIRLKSMITYWMGSRVHSLAIKTTNDLTCDILNGSIVPPTDVHGPLWATELWADTARASLLACPSASPPIVYLHMIVHIDDYKPYDRSRMQYTMVAISLGEFDTGQRADRSNSFLIPYTIFRRKKESKEEAFVEMDKVSELLKVEFQELFKDGEFKVYSVAHRKSVFVRAFPYLLVGDSVARNEFTGIIRPSPNSSKRCFICGLDRDGRVKKRFWAEELPYRDLARARQMWDLVRRDGRLADKSEALWRPSNVWNWPNFDPIRQQGIDIMHLEGIGLLQLHIQLLNLTKEEYEDVSAKTKFFSRHFGGRFTSSISTFGQFKQLTARDKFFFALLTPITFTLCLLPERLNAFIFRAWWNHFVYTMIMTKFVISSEELDMAKEEAKKCWSKLIKEKVVKPNRPNIHLLIHQFGNILNFGVPRGYWCFPFESVIQGLRFIESRNSNRRSSYILILKRQWELCLLESYLQQAKYLKPIYSFDRSSKRVVCAPMKLPKNAIIEYVSNTDSSGKSFGFVLHALDDQFAVVTLRALEHSAQGVPGYHRFPYEASSDPVTTNVPRSHVIAYFYGIRSTGYLFSVPYNF